eukprot:GILJ01008759.1.p1 GENE.GILJ01008759.1~~GILJ01008759.1.p1  ORF type:complete len:139 (-),score=9.97 GILJ01008759.1:126-542(-)
MSSSFLVYIFALALLSSTSATATDTASCIPPYFQCPSHERAVCVDGRPDCVAAAMHHSFRPSRVPIKIHVDYGGNTTPGCDPACNEDQVCDADVHRCVPILGHFCGGYTRDPFTCPAGFTCQSSNPDIADIGGTCVRV